MTPSNNKATFLSGSIITDVVNTYGGLIATQETIVHRIAWGPSGSTPQTVLNPRMKIAAGTHIPVRFNSLTASGSLVLYR